MGELYIGIDLATTYCAVAYMPEGTTSPKIIKLGGKELTPSVICFEGRDRYFCGWDAKEEQQANNPDCASVFKRNIGSLEKTYEFHGKKYSAGDLSGILLAHLKQEVEAEMKQAVTGAVITVPAYFEDVQRRETITACKNAGIPFMGLLDEPVAAALTYGTNGWKKNSRFMVYDLGGGTFDVTIVKMGEYGKMEVETTHGDHQLGGVDWDACLLSVVCDAIEEATGIDLHDDVSFAARNAGNLESTKIRLSEQPSIVMKYYVEGTGNVQVTITRAAFEERSQAIVERTMILCEAMLKGKGLAWGDVDDILLVGGSTRMPMIKAALEARSGKQAKETLHPDYAVALGAAIQAKLLSELGDIDVGGGATEKKGMFGGLLRGRRKPGTAGGSSAGSEVEGEIGWAPVARAVPHSLGVIAVSGDGKRYVSRRILERNMKSPCKAARKFQFRTRAGDPNLLEIYVTQGEDEENPLGNTIFARYTTNVPHKTKDGRVKVRVMYSYDENGLADVAVRLEGEEHDLPIHRSPMPDDIDKFAGAPPEPPRMTQPTYLMLSVDVSGSMSGEPLQAAQREMINFIDRMSGQLDDVHFCITVVSNTNKEMTNGFTADARAAKAAVMAITCGMTGYGNLGHPFTSASTRFAGVEGRKIQIVLADGVWSNQPRAVECAKACHREDIEICGMGFGYADQQFLKDISSTDQMAVYTTSYSQLDQAFGSIAQVIGGSGRGGKGGLESGGEEITETWESDSKNTGNQF